MKRTILVLLTLTCLAVSESVLAAKKKPAARTKTPARAAQTASAGGGNPNFFETPFRKTPYVGALSYDVDGGRVLFSSGADALARPASVTKLMTMLLVLEDISAGKYTYDTLVTATPDVYKSEPSTVGIRPGETMTVESLLFALMVHSANDVAIMLGVHSAGSLAGFVARMNSRAAELGMTSTKYFNPNGLPPKRKNGTADFNVTTCSDQLKLAKVLVKNPRVFHYTSVKVWPATYDGVRPITGKDKSGKDAQRKYVNHNNVMVKDKLKVFNPDGKESVDGLKTGYIDAGGSSVVLTGTRNGHRVIVIVLGSSSAKNRDENARMLMQKALTSVAGS